MNKDEYIMHFNIWASSEVWWDHEIPNRLEIFITTCEENFVGPFNLAMPP
jgi:hypothetical protein